MGNSTKEEREKNKRRTRHQKRKNEKRKKHLGEKTTKNNNSRQPCQIDCMVLLRGLV